MHRALLQESGAESERQRGQIPPQIFERTGTVTSTVLARERTLPVAAAFRGVLPDGGLARGRTLACTGDARWSVAFALASEAVGHGSWIAAVGLPALGVEAVAELGVALDRLVRIDARPTASWAEVVAAAVDGFDLVIAAAPAGSGAAGVRRVQTRVKARGAVLVLVGESAAADIRLHTDRPDWERAARGAGHLRARRVRLEVGGRRVPQPRRVELLLPGPDGQVEVAAAAAAPAEAPMELLRSAG